MSEIKTCEQYVLARLQELEEENERLKDNLESVTGEIEKLTVLRTILPKYLKRHQLKTASEPNGYLQMSDIDEWHEEKQYDYAVLCDILDLKFSDL